jgi:hypothetical protein
MPGHPVTKPTAAPRFACTNQLTTLLQFWWKALVAVLMSPHPPTCWCICIGPAQVLAWKTRQTSHTMHHLMHQTMHHLMHTMHHLMHHTMHHLMHTMHHLMHTWLAGPCCWCEVQLALQSCLGRTVRSEGGLGRHTATAPRPGRGAGLTAGCKPWPS